MTMYNIKRNIRVISWNIQSSNSVCHGNKFQDNDFCKNFTSYPIVCLQEIRQSVKYPGYKSFNNTRAKENDGGVCTLVRHEIFNGIKQHPCKISDVVVCKLKSTFFNLETDIFIVNAYIKPANTSTVTDKKSGRDRLHEIDTYINELSAKGCILLCGDFNSRIGREIDFILNDNSGADSFIPLPEDYITQDISPRNTKDLKTNSHKKPFLDMLINNRLHILNGRTLGDSQGELTCIKPNGSSLVDYFIISSDHNKLVSHMKVKEFTIYSDHKPLELSLNFSVSNTNQVEPLHKSFDKAPQRYKVTSSSKDDFLESMEKNAQTACHILDTSYEKTHNGSYSLNDDITKYLQDTASDSMELTKIKRQTNSYTNNQPWFGKENRVGKQNLRKAAYSVSQCPESDYLRQNFYKVKNHYKTLNKNKQDEFSKKINSDIENGKILNWNQFKKLKNHKSKNTVFDSVDMKNFEKFFGKLYSNEHATISSEKKAEFLEESVRISNDYTPSNYQDNTDLNKPFTCKEIADTVLELKNGKSSSDDTINNEMLKYLTAGANGTQLLEKLFNHCFDTATYPWNNSIITPLHKKGCKSDPDNYRAVAVSSTIGKLFSTILLNRILATKNKTCPDPVNQLGFSKGAQTYDHVLTLSTIVSKYKRLKKPVYAVFVDFRKAFDSVCREALFLKLASQGICGKIFETLKHMYANSTGQIKLSGHISNKFSIDKGTEQGHPLSPDFFKLYINDLSPLLEHTNCPTLMEQIVSHLLWADDLILLALDPATLQNQLNSLSQFCTDWGVEINMSKTKLIAFNSNKSDTFSLKLCNKHIQGADSYCYLGIEIDKSGKFTLARKELSKKALRSLYSLKNTVNKKHISFRSLTTLFDSLIKPIALYGAPIWAPGMPIFRNLTKQFWQEYIESNSSLLKKISQSECERIHTHFLKWALGVNRKASNAGIWGESGRYPIIYEGLMLTLKYFNRIKRLNNDTLVSLAYQEQKRLKLEWYNGIESILRTDSCYSADHVSSYLILKKKTSRHTLKDHSTHCTSITNHSQCSFIIHKGIKKSLPKQKLLPLSSERFSVANVIKSFKKQFRDAWDGNLTISRKLCFYKTLKSSFKKEPYLDLVNNYKDRNNLTRLRISAHHLEIERGRYNNVPKENRTCAWCKLCLGSDIIEDETHLLNECDLYAANRAITSQKLSLSETSSIQNNKPHLAPVMIEENKIPPEENAQFFQTLARFITICFNRRKKFIESLNSERD